jgi:F0F1-type ATP synthase membrane subunit b/b'
MLNLDIWTVAFQIINFLALAGLLYYLLFRPVTRSMKKRAAEKERITQEIAQNREAAAQLRTELEVRLEHAEEEAANVIARGNEQAQANQQALLEEAEVEVERILAEAQADAHRLRSQAVEDFHDELLDAILEISGQVIGQAAPPEVHDALVQQLCDRIWELGRSEMERVEAFRRSLGERAPTAYVTSAHPLSPEQQGLLVRTFTALADRDVNLDLSTDPTLAAGIQVRLGDFIVDNSIAGQLAELREAVSGTLEERLVHE